MVLNFKDQPVIFNLDLLDIIIIIVSSLTLYVNYLNYFTSIELNNNIYMQVSHMTEIKTHLSKLNDLQKF